MDRYYSAAAGASFFVWSFVVLFLSCRVLLCCGVVLVVSCVVLFLLCVCVFDLFFFLQTSWVALRGKEICSLPSIIIIGSSNSSNTSSGTSSTSSTSTTTGRVPCFSSYTNLVGSFAREGDV